MTPHAIREHTTEMFALDDGQIARLDREGFEIMLPEGTPVESNPLELDEEWGVSDLGDYPHFMLKEIHEQSESLQHCISGRLRHSSGSANLGGLDITPKALSTNPLTFD